MSAIFLARVIPGVAAVAVIAASPVVWAKTIQVEVQARAFSPARITARVGDTIVWNNKDFLLHSATSHNHELDVNLPPHSSGRAVLKKTGTIEYYCRFHPNM